MTLGCLWVYIGLLIVSIYTIIMSKKLKGVPPSLSDTFYLGGGWWFTITMFVSAIPIMMGLIELAFGTPWQFLGFLSGIGMVIVGGAPHFHEYEHTIHMTGAFILVTFSQLWVWVFTSPWCLLFWLTAFLWWNTRQRVFWLEMTCLLSVAIGLIALI